MTGGKRSRNKGAAGELELARILAKHGFNARRTPNSGGLAIKGDLTATDGTGAAIPGFHLEGKRCETLRIPDWLQQAHADAGGLVPLVAFRRNKTRAPVDPLGEWHALLPLEDLLKLLRELEDLRSKITTCPRCGGDTLEADLTYSGCADCRAEQRAA